ncbi:MAG: 5-formyltetrahydrofolate cyclo-ligase [Clostridia bacterium]|nr:5-formyltetrahydrofolate cyclo-ligase [Clostridia bacterium]
MNKTDARKIVKAEKAKLVAQDVKSYSEAVAEVFLKQDFYRDAQVIYPYLAYNTEIDTRYIIERAWQDGKIVAVPRVLDDTNMEFFVITSFDDVELGYHDIPEPTTSETVSAKDVLMIMPGLAFDEAHNRVGYGGGFYDRYLEKKESEGIRFKKVSLAYDFQVVDNLEVEAYDIPVDNIVTSKAVL